MKRGVEHFATIEPDQSNRNRALSRKVTLILLYMQHQTRRAFTGGGNKALQLQTGSQRSVCQTQCIISQSHYLHRQSDLPGVTGFHYGRFVFQDQFQSWDTSRRITQGLDVDKLTGKRELVHAVGAITLQLELQRQQLQERWLQYLLYVLLRVRRTSS